MTSVHFWRMGSDGSRVSFGSRKDRPEMGTIKKRGPRVWVVRIHGRQYPALPDSVAAKMFGKTLVDGKQFETYGAAKQFVIGELSGVAK